MSEDTRPVVLATAHEMLRAATGHPIALRTLDGQQVWLRLPTVEEFRRVNAQARESQLAKGLEVPDPPSTPQIVSIVAPLEFP